MFQRDFESSWWGLSGITLAVRKSPDTLWFHIITCTRRWHAHAMKQHSVKDSQSDVTYRSLACVAAVQYVVTST